MALFNYTYGTKAHTPAPIAPDGHGIPAMRGIFAPACSLSVWSPLRPIIVEMADGSGIDNPAPGASHDLYDLTTIELEVKEGLNLRSEDQFTSQPCANLKIGGRAATRAAPPEA